MGGGAVGLCRWQKHLCGCTRKLILVRDLFLQSEAQSRFPVWFPVPKWTGETCSVHNSGVDPYEHEYIPDVEPTVYMWKGVFLLNNKIKHDSIWLQVIFEVYSK